jgi:hypothetical protein
VSSVPAEQIAWGTLRNICELTAYVASKLGWGNAFEVSLAPAWLAGMLAPLEAERGSIIVTRRELQPSGSEVVLLFGDDFDLLRIARFSTPSLDRPAGCRTVC